ncbi:down syndrome cell adhesion molecule-like protein Dscam2 [Trichonephila clavipes]|nr:down syndrome cell adhesion molecule-like protein Dscam2 [Trichonephila clavipes]
MSVRGPSFEYEPPSRVDFDNSTGAVIRCSAKGRPTPDLWWETKNGSIVREVPGLQHLRPDGSMVFAPFTPMQYRREVHDAIYRCVAANVAGKIGSREVRVRADVLAMEVMMENCATNIKSLRSTEQQKRVKNCK